MKATSPAAPVLDFVRFEQRLDGDRLLMLELAALYLCEYPRQLAEIREAVISGDACRLQFAAHGIKGAVRNFSAAPAGDAAQVLEDMGESGNTACSSEVHRLAFELQRLHEALQAFIDTEPSGSERGRRTNKEGRSRLQE